LRRRRRRRSRSTSCGLASCLQELRRRIIFIMGIVSTMLGVVGFGWGLSLGLVVGYFVFIYFQPNDVKVMRCCYSLSVSVFLCVSSSALLEF
jgi:hypothetical protein